MADAELGILFGEALPEDFAEVGLAVAVGVFQEEDMGGGGDDEAALPGEEAVGEEEVVGEECGVFVEAVAVSIFEGADAAGGGLA